MGAHQRRVALTASDLQSTGGIERMSSEGARWIRFVDPAGNVGFGTVDEGDAGVDVVVHAGDMFTGAEPTGERVSLDAVELLIPCQPTKLIGLWNNLRAASDKNRWATPEEPLYFLKPPSSFVGHGATIVRPSSYPGRILYEGELGVVIGTTCVDVAIDDVDDVVFGYTCINDVTALDLLNEDPSFPQWCRAKGFDTFGAIGPVIATGLDPDALQVRTLVGGKIRQDYPVRDMIFSPRQLVSLISRDMTLSPGDVIACGTSTGAMPMRPGVPVDVHIDGIGVLSNSLGE
jgi:2-keto-4-pentenoate hydratase/2-oxohepta-3-ene-1,7-dioic acid hydratase in catechol pathway